MQAEEYLNNYSYSSDIVGFEREIKLLKDFAEAYHKAKVEAISDEVLQKRSGVNHCYVDDKDNDEAQGFYEGCKWILHKLLNKIQ